MSVNEAPATAVALELLSVTVITDVPLTATAEGAKALVTVSGTSTVRVSLAAVTLLPAVETTAPTGIVLM